MDITELMCGDWVYNSVLKRNEKVIIADSIYHKAITLYTDGDCTAESEILEDNIEPIEITPEILKKNGFDVDLYAYFGLDNGKYIQYYFHEHRFRVLWTGIDEWEDHAKVTNILFQSYPSSVHELQHSLKLSKIDKKIIL